MYRQKISHFVPCLTSVISRKTPAFDCQKWVPRHKGETIFYGESKYCLEFIFRFFHMTEAGSEIRVVALLTVEVVIWLAILRSLVIF